MKNLEKEKPEKKRIEKKITLGRDAEGKLIRKSIYAKTKAELEKKVFAARQEWLTNAPKTSNDITFGSYAERWFLTEKSRKSIATKAMYRNVLNVHLMPVLGDMYFSEITLADLQQILDRNFEKYETCNKIKLTLRQIYAAVSDEDGIELPRINLNKLIIPKKKKNEKRPLNDAEKAAVINAPFDAKHRAFVWILYYTGMRREEALALMPSDFDFKAKTVTISRTLVFDRGRAVIVQDAKSSHSLRTILLPDKCIDLIREYVSTCGKYVFPMKGSDEPMSMASFRRFWETITRTMVTIAPTAAELTPHMFRHNYATQLYYSGITIKKAAQLMGHADTTMIMKVYAHLDEEKENTATKLNAVF